MTILIEDLSFNAILGILKQERDTPQKIRVNCVFEYNYSHDKFVDYVQVSKLIKTQIQRQKFQLIEEALEFLEQSIQENFPAITYLRLKITKPQILENCLVSAQLEKNY